MKINRFFNTLLFPALALAAHAAMAADHVKIGALYPLSGQVAKSGEDTLNGIRLAVDIINNKTPDVALPFAAGEGLPGLGNAKIELIAADHQGSPEIGAAEAERLITQRKVAALIGAFHSSVAATSSQVAERTSVRIRLCRWSGRGASRDRSCPIVTIVLIIAPFLIRRHVSYCLDVNPMH